jgi:hypothetical protein
MFTPAGFTQVARLANSAWHVLQLVFHCRAAGPEAGCVFQATQISPGIPHYFTEETMSFQNKTIINCLLAIGAAMLSTPVFALNCGDTVSGTVTLTADLTCSKNALIVGAKDTTIELNGHTITCKGGGGGYLGSCQNWTGTPMPFPVSVVGVTSVGHSNVQVHGPGTITGFGVGIFMGGGPGLNVTGVTITGPSAPVSTDFDLKRLLTVGVVIADTQCAGPATVAPGWASVVNFNDISEQEMGVQLAGASCVLVTGNNIHDNAGVTGDSHGIDVIASSENTIMANAILRNGANLGENGGIDGGIKLLNAGSFANQVLYNYVVDNCGDGITAQNGAHDNNITLNVALNNSTSTNGGKCVAVPVGTFFDVSDRNEGTGNIWNTNNTCKTKNAGIPAGVCQ